MERDVILEGKIEGKKEDIIEELEEKGTLTPYQRMLINQENDLDTLKKWIRSAYKTESIDEFFKQNLNGYWQSKNAIDTVIEELLTNIVKNMKGIGINIKAIAKVTGLTVEEVAEILTSLGIDQNKFE